MIQERTAVADFIAVALCATMDADSVIVPEKTWQWPYRIVLQPAYCLLSEDFRIGRGHSPIMVPVALWRSHSLKH